MPWDNAINPGSRLVNNSVVSAAHTFGVPSFTVAFPVDCTNAVSFSTQWSIQSAGATAGTVGIQLQWTDLFGNVLDIETYELNCGLNNTATTTYLSGRCRGPLLNIFYIGNGGVTGNPTVALINVSTLTVPCDRTRITEVLPTATIVGDGLLAGGSVSAAPGITSAKVFCGLTAGPRIFASIACSAAPITTWSVVLGWGLSQSDSITVVPVAGNPGVFVEFPATNHPLVLTAKNTGATNTASAFFSVWANGSAA